MKTILHVQSTRSWIVGDKVHRNTCMFVNDWEVDLNQMVFLSVSQVRSEKPTWIKRVGVDPDTYWLNSGNSTILVPLTKKSLPSPKQFLFLSQSLPFPAVTFCNFNAIKYSSFLAAKVTEREFVDEFLEVEPGKFICRSMFARPGWSSHPGFTY